MSFDPRNILVIDFGQLGDVVLSLPALRALRRRFSAARITVLVGKPGAEIVNLSGYADSTLIVDRVALRDGSKISSITKIIMLVRQVRREHFDLVIDLHSLSETNLLGFLSGAPKRLYARRPGRSLDYLANFPLRAPIEKNNRQHHIIDSYLDVLGPLGVNGSDRLPRLKSTARDDAVAEGILKKAKANSGTPLVGMFPGAGHPSRRWPLRRFAELAEYLIRNDQVRVFVFAGPEERHHVQEFRSLFPPQTLVLDKLTIPELAAIQARLAVFVCNDTGPMHIASAMGTPVVLLLSKDAPESYLPLGDRHRVIYNRRIGDITTDVVYEAARAVLAGNRTASLFAS